MFRVIPAHQLPPRLEVSWLWEGMVAQGTLALLGGPGGVGKSTLVAALEVAVAAGVPFLEREVAQGEVLHVDYDTDPRLQGPWYPKVAAGLGVNGRPPGRLPATWGTWTRTKVVLEPDWGHLRPGGGGAGRPGGVVRKRGPGWSFWTASWPLSPWTW